MHLFVEKLSSLLHPIEISKESGLEMPASTQAKHHWKPLFDAGSQHNAAIQTPNLPPRPLSEQIICARAST